MNETNRGHAEDPGVCSREPIHIPGCIQPHGALAVVAEPVLTVTQASENFAALTGVAAAQIIGKPLSTLLDDLGSRALRDVLARGHPEEHNPLRMVLNGRRFDGIVHRHEGATIVEFEPLAPDAPPYSPHHALRPALLRLESAESLPALYEQILFATRELTGFERVMIYRFDERGHGSVDAELKEPGLEPFLGVHYPASDIPQQARQLYMKNWMRIIPDARYVPSPLVPALRPDTGAPLDLSFAALRSVSTIHREYLANMGVTGSMSLSLVVRGRLWGLISCTNHSSPRYVRYELRSACEVLARLASLEIAAIEDRQAEAARVARRGIESALGARMRGAGPEADVLASLLGDEAKLLNLVNAAGAAVVTGDSCETCGRAPPHEFVMDISEWLDRNHGRSIFATQSLAAQWPGAADEKDVASGLLTFALPGSVPRRLLWFRGEVLGSVNWGGDPNKAVEAAMGGRPHPRRSFAIWKEEVRMHSAVWTGSDLEAAEDLRRYAVEADLGLQLAREHRAVRARDEVLGVVSHDLRNPLYVIGFQAHEFLLRSSMNPPTSTELQAGAKLVERAVEQMNSLIDNLLDLASIEAGRLQLRTESIEVKPTIDKVLETLRPLADARQQALITVADAGLWMRVDINRFYQVLSNLIGNAVKHTPPGGRITIAATATGDTVTFTVTDTGPGFSAEALAKLFVRYGRAEPGSGRHGVGLGLFVVKGIVEAHGGEIRGHNAPEGGAAVVFTLPRV
ncbi:MAG TPA: ATP-binding protein [Steroidobacteraceae bacterium]|nr:ATP-binding protein [Steroidobacteraceae bacterium]